MKKRFLSAFLALSLILSMSLASPQAGLAAESGIELVPSAAELREGDAVRLYLDEADAYGVDRIVYGTPDSDKIEISPEGVVSLKPGYGSASDVEVTVTAQVDYYASPLFADSFEGEK